MVRAPVQPRDPLAWCVLIAAGFWLLVSANLAIPSHPYFDEVHYIPAAREVLALGTFVNREHPLLGKELIALGVAILGDNPWGWRIASSLAGTLALYAGMRAIWFATLSRFATIVYGLLLASGFFLFVHSRIAMLDVFMVAFMTLAWWQIAAAMREPETGRRRLALAGVALGLSMASKWNGVALAMVPGLGFLILRWRAGRRRLLTSRRGGPVPGVTLLGAALWLGLLPIAVYALTYLPGWYFARDAIAPGPFSLIDHHRFMLDLQEQQLPHHNYQSHWTDWVINWRAIWYMWEVTDGAQRGVLLVGNPLTMLLGLPALGWCLWQALVGRRPAHGAAVLIYAVALGFWIVAAKPVQFYYHYFLASMALLAALALALEDARRAGWVKAALGVPAASLALFAYFLPILSAAPLSGPQAFLSWSWLHSWV